MTLETWLMYLGTILVFMSTPGPSQLLIISISMSNGFHRSIATAAGDLSANTLQIILAGFGLATLLVASELGFTIVKWLGIAYLIWMGLKKIIASFEGNSGVAKAAPESLKSLWLKGFVTSAANPKAVVFFAALFPQFIDPDKPAFMQIVILGITYLTIDGLFLLTYGKSADWMVSKIKHSARVWVDRASGAGLIVTALLLALKSSKTIQVQ